MKRRLREADSYGWIVNDYQAEEAYEFACDYFGKDFVDSEIVDYYYHNGEVIAKALAYMFRMNEFREWYEYLENKDREDDEDFEESFRRNRRFRR